VIKVEIGKFLAISPMVRFTAYQRKGTLEMWVDIKVHVAHAHIVKQEPCSTLPENTSGKIQALHFDGPSADWVDVG
jgi:hypothetical protein